MHNATGVRYVGNGTSESPCTRIIFDPVAGAVQFIELVVADALTKVALILP